MKKEVKLFVCYAKKNQVAASDLIERLKDYARPSRKYNYVFWRDVELLAGQDWAAEINRNIQACHCGILLISTSFLNSDYIKNIELPRLFANNKIIIPVALSKINFDKHDLLGLEQYQIFRLQSTGLDGPKEYSSLKSSQRKEEFVDKLFVQIETLLDDQKLSICISTENTKT